MKKIIPLALTVTLLTSTAAFAQVEVYSLDTGQAIAPNYSYEPIEVETPVAIEPTYETYTDTDSDSGTSTANSSNAWNGIINAGASKQSGNTDKSSINLDGKLTGHWSKKHRATFKAEYNRETDNGSKTEDNKKASAQYDYFFQPKWFWDGKLQLEQDDLSNIDLRSTLSGGLGHQVYDADDLKLHYIFGPSWLRTNYENDSSEDSFAAHWELDYEQSFRQDLFRLFHEQELTVPVDDNEAYFLDTKSGIRIPLKQGLIASGEIEFDRDNKPETGIEKNDTTYSAKLGYEW